MQSDPESTDECLNTVVHGLWSFDSVEPNKDPERTRNPGEQEGDFQPEFDDQRNGKNVFKVVVLLTDAPPGGFEDPDILDEWICDPFALNAHAFALDAAEKNICIVPILVGPDWMKPWAVFQNSLPTMLDYGHTTEGWFSLISESGVAVEEAVLDALYDPVGWSPSRVICND